jgi:hypothetical protein
MGPIRCLSSDHEIGLAPPVLPTPPLFPMTKQRLEKVRLGRTTATAVAR